MKKIILAAIAAATILPSAAMAQPFGRHETRQVVVEHRGPAFHRLTVGERLEPGFIARQDHIRNPGRYHLARANGNREWLRIGRDAVLVNVRNGRIVDIVHRVF